MTPGRFLLIAGEDGHAWCEAARRLAEDGRIPIDFVRIGHLDGDLYDPRCLWLRHRQIGSDGAVLVRPDRVIAWRQPTAVDDACGVLAGALGQVFGAAGRVELARLHAEASADHSVWLTVERVNPAD